MITGVVTSDFAAIIRLTVLGAGNRSRKIDALVDTGSDGWLSLPPDLIRLLKLPWKRRGRALVADGSNDVFDIYEGTVFWERRRRRIPIDETETMPLVGMSLLRNCELKVQIRVGGKVSIRPLGTRAAE